MTDSLVPVRVGACLCPGSPHPDGDFVYLRPILDLRGGFRVKHHVIELNRAAQIRSIRAAAAGGVKVEQLAKQWEVGVGDIQELLSDRGEATALMAVDDTEREIALAESYLDEGIAAWNLEDESGPLEVTPENLRTHLFNNYGRVQPAADKADELYRPAVIDPLFQKALSSLVDTPTNGLTSPTNGVGQKRQKRSKRSSTVSTQTASTEAIT